MNTKPRWWWLLVGILLISSACSLFSTVLNPVDKAVSEIEDLATQVDVDQLGEELSTLATELPSTLEAMPNVDDLGDIQATADAFQESFTSGEAPPDIPRVDEREDLFASQDIVSYSTTLSLDEVLAFYQEQMPINDWQPVPDSSVIMAESVILAFEKPNRSAFVTLNLDPQSGKTLVSIVIQPK